MMAFLPPISSETRLRVSRASMATCCPAAVEPVNEISLTPGVRTMASPTVPPGPKHHVDHAGRKPASSSICTSSMRQQGRVRARA